jgi:protoheme IX farnesyltransferase
MGMRLGVGPFFLPIAHDLGFSRSLLATIVAVGMLCFGLAMPVAGYLVARRGTRFVLLLGTAIVFAASVWSVLARDPVTFLLAFGVLLSTTATWLLAQTANVLTAALGLAGFYFYVFIYTRWLKRSTPQNIVIGGAAGAFPPLVGWAAVTNRVDLFAVYLFLIIFYWTPPHFWALALLKQKDYGKAGVPMAPLVWGEAETKRQMFWYTLILIPLTLLPYCFGALGIVYLGLAAILDAIFLAELLRVIRAADFNKLAWKLYRFSLLYLALLFAAMVVDRAILT